MLQISLADNKLTIDDLEDRMAVVQNRKQKSVADIVNQLTVEGSILKPTECEAVITGMLRTIVKNLREGYGFQSDYFSLTPSVSGVFVNDKDRFDPARHQVELNLRLSAPMKEALDQVKVEVIPHTAPVPVIRQVFDRKSKTTNDRLTPGHTLEISGTLLKIEEPTAAEQGVFLVNTNKDEEVKLPYLYQNTPKMLQAELPDTLKRGTYRLEVRTAVYNIREVRTGAAPFTLTVS